MELVTGGGVTEGRRGALAQRKRSSICGGGESDRGYCRTSFNPLETAKQGETMY